MAKFDTGIDISEVDRSADQSRELLPWGDYLMELIAIDQKRDGNNVAHSYTYEVIEPEQFRKRRVWDWIDLQNDAEWKQKKGQARIANLCDSIGYDPVQEGILDDDDNLMFRAFMAKVVQEPGGTSRAGKDFKAKNVVDRFYKPADKDAPSAANIYEHQPELPASKSAPANDNRRPAANQNQPAQQQAAAGSRPWKR